MDNKELEMAKEVERVYRDTLDYKSSYRQVVEQYKKAHSLATTQENEPIQKLLPTV